MSRCDTSSHSLELFIHFDEGRLKGHSSTSIYVIFFNLTMQIVDLQQHDIITCLTGQSISDPNTKKVIVFSFYGVKLVFTQKVM